MREWLTAGYDPRSAWRRVEETLGLPDEATHTRTMEAFRKCENAPTAFYQERAKAKVDISKVDLWGLGRGLLGHGWENKRGAMTRGQRRVMEATESVDPSAFADITGQLLVTLVQEQYGAPEWIGEKLVRVYDESSPQNFLTHIVPLISNVTSGPQQVNSGMPYPISQMVEDYISLPAVGKYGEILNLSMEFLMQDRTGQAQDSAAKLGHRARYDLEIDMLGPVLGLVNNFSWKGTSYNTYQSSGSNWINAATGQAIPGSDYSIIDTLEQLSNQILDPYTGIPLNDTEFGPVLCMKEAQKQMETLLQGTINVGLYPQIPYGASNLPSGATGSAAQSEGNIQTQAGNQLKREREVITSKVARQMLINSGLSAAQVKNYFFMADWKKAFIYRQFIPIKVVQAPPENPLQFNNDIVTSLKVMRIGKTGVWNARYALFSKNT